MKPVPDLSRAEWRSSSYGGSGAIQVAFVDDVIVVRNGTDPDGPVLVFTRAEWDAFLGGAKDGEFTLPE
jgi:Domain of unknown function (DUF397)